MVKSKFKLIALIIPILILALVSVSTVILIENSPLKIDKIRWIDVYMTILFLFTIIGLIFGELRTKIIVIEIKNNYINKKNYLGFNQNYNFKDFDGFQTSIFVSKGERFEYLYLVKDNKKIIKISQAYHKNYFELKDKISIHLKNLGEIEFSYIDELKEIFK